jgi:hypothetical protein
VKKLSIFAAIFGILLAAGGVFIWTLIGMPGRSFEGPAPALDTAERALAEQLDRDIRHLAVDIGERNVGNRPEALAETAAFVREQLTTAGYTISAEKFTVDPQFRSKDAAGPRKASVEVENLVVEKLGTTAPKEIIVVGAHYDSAPGTAGADDNASGVAVGLALARSFAKRAPARTVRFVFFTNEEPPWFRSEFMGSAVHAKASRARGDDIKAMLSLETMAYFSDEPKSQHYPFPLSLFYPSTGNFIAFVANKESRDLVREVVGVFREHAKVASEGAAVPASIQGVDWSDHGPFWKQQYPAFMVTDTAPFRNPNYHEMSDTVDRLDLARLAYVAQGLDKVVDHLSRNKTAR